MDRQCTDDAAGLCMAPVNLTGTYDNSSTGYNLYFVLAVCRDEVVSSPSCPRIALHHILAVQQHRLALIDILLVKLGDTECGDIAARDCAEP